MTLRARVTRDDSAYPAIVEERLQARPPIAAFGNLDLLRSQPLAFFCSIKCPGDVILRTYDLIRAGDAGVAMIGAFSFADGERVPDPASAGNSAGYCLSGSQHRRHAHSWLLERTTS